MGRSLHVLVALLCAVAAPFVVRGCLDAAAVRLNRSVCDDDLIREQIQDLEVSGAFPSANQCHHDLGKVRKALEALFDQLCVTDEKLAKRIHNIKMLYGIVQVFPGPISIGVEKLLHESKRSHRRCRYTCEPTLAAVASRLNSTNVELKTLSNALTRLIKGRLNTDEWLCRVISNVTKHRERLVEFRTSVVETVNRYFDSNRSTCSLGDSIIKMTRTLKRDFADDEGCEYKLRQAAGVLVTAKTEIEWATDTVASKLAKCKEEKLRPTNRILNRLSKWIREKTASRRGSGSTWEIFCTILKHADNWKKLLRQFTPPVLPAKKDQEELERQLSYVQDVMPKLETCYTSTLSKLDDVLKIQQEGEQEQGLTLQIDALTQLLKQLRKGKWPESDGCELTNELLKNLTLHL